MFEFNQAYRRGDAARKFSEEEVVRLLGVPFSKTAPNGFVTLNKRMFSSPALRAKAADYAARNGGNSLPVEGFEAFSSAFHVIWDDGYLDELEASELTMAKLGRVIPELYSYYIRWDNADWSQAKDRYRHHPTVSPPDPTRVSKATQKQMALAEQAAIGVDKRGMRRAATADSGADETAALLDSLRPRKKELPVAKSVLSPELPPELLYSVDEQTPDEDD
jgi:hypothetical protein